jgi:hypothetical protein
LAPTSARRRYAAEANDLDTSVVFAGEAVDLIRGVKRAVAIVETLVREAEALIESTISCARAVLCSNSLASLPQIARARTASGTRAA